MERVSVANDYEVLLQFARLEGTGVGGLEFCLQKRKGVHISMTFPAVYGASDL